MQPSARAPLRYYVAIMTDHADPSWSFRRLQWVFPIAVTIHNTEEAVWLPSWAAQHAEYMPWHPGAAQFRLALAALTVAAFAITGASVRRGPRSPWTYLFISYTAVMFLNVFVPHIPASIYLRSYTPGVVSAAFVNLPVTAMLLIRAVQERIVAGWPVGLGVFGIPAAGAVGAAILFASRLPK